MKQLCFTQLLHSPFCQVSQSRHETTILTASALFWERAGIALCINRLKHNKQMIAQSEIQATRRGASELHLA
jgi:hypothetical protein